MTERVTATIDWLAKDGSCVMLDGPGADTITEHEIESMVAGIIARRAMGSEMRAAAIEFAKLYRINENTIAARSAISDSAIEAESEALLRLERMSGEGLSTPQLERLCELVASYCHGSAEYWNPKDAGVFIGMARRMADCSEAAGLNVVRAREEPKVMQWRGAGGEVHVGINPPAYAVDLREYERAKA